MLIVHDCVDFQFYIGISYMYGLLAYVNGRRKSRFTLHHVLIYAAYLFFYIVLIFVPGIYKIVSKKIHYSTLK